MTSLAYVWMIIAIVLYLIPVLLMGLTCIWENKTAFLFNVILWPVSFTFTTIANRVVSKRLVDTKSLFEDADNYSISDEEL